MSNKQTEQMQHNINPFGFGLMPSWTTWAAEGAARAEEWNAQIAKMQGEMTARAKDQLTDMHKLAVDSLEYMNSLWAEWRAMAVTGVKSAAKGESDKAA
ncbi:MAG: hypothetical protein KJO07_01200 [Deltaproteobacteria bacterium]|nr:hypothetical protein [Deltaproteobacteria bacterium]